VPILRFFIPFAAAYFLSSLFRAVIGVISPELAREFTLSAQDLGALASLYFYAFAFAQIPAGVLLDRFGPRRAESALLLAAATGALLFCFADSFAALGAGRVLIGIGVAICFAAPLKAAAMWYGPDKQVALSGWIMLVGGLGASFATKPVEMALAYFDWRTLFAGLAVLSTLAAAGIVWGIRDIQVERDQRSMAEQWRGLGKLLVHRRFWWVMPWAFTGMGTFISVQGLWGMQWLMHGVGYSKADAASLLLAVSLISLSGYFFIGAVSERLARRGISNRHLLATGMVVDLVSLLAISLQWPGEVVWWCLYGLGTSLNVLTFTVLTHGLPPALVGRGNTGLNLFMFIGTGSISFLVGWLISQLQAQGMETSTAFGTTFLCLTAMNALAAAWFLMRWRAHSTHASQGI
jgi:MFS family permease